MTDTVSEASQLLVEKTTSGNAVEVTSNSFDPATDLQTLNYARRLLYVSHFFAQFSETAWQFALVLLLAAFVQYKSLLLISTYGIISNGTVCLFSSYVGTQLIDNCSHQRLRAAQFFVWTENVCVIIASILCYVLLVRSEASMVVRSSSDNGLPTDWLSILLLIGIHFFGPVAQLLDQGFVVAIEKDWVVVMGQVAAKAYSSESSLAFKTREEFNNEEEIHFNDDQQDQLDQKQQRHPQTTEIDTDYGTITNGSTSSNNIKENHRPNDNKRFVYQKGPSNVIEVKNEWLIRTNVTMKQIDLSCRVLSPAISGYIVDAFGASPTQGATSSRSGLSTGAVFIGLINVASLIAEYVCTAEIYRLIPELSYPTTLSSTSTNVNIICKSHNNISSSDKSNDLFGKNRDNNNNCDFHSNQVCKLQGDYSTNPDIGMNHNNHDVTLHSIKMTDTNNKFSKEVNYKQYICTLSHDNTTTNKKHKLIESFYVPPSLTTYFQQPVSHAGLGLALLYLNTLTFGGLMMSYLLFRGMSISTVGFWRGISSVIGLLGTFAYQQSTQRYSLETTGMWSIIYQFVCITASMVSMYIKDYTISMALLIAGVCTSRIGLYVFDITVTQLMQQHIPESIRGVVGGTQTSLNAFFQLSAFLLCSIFSNPNDFVIVVAAGYIAVAVAVALYIFGIYFKKL